MPTTLWNSLTAWTAEGARGRAAWAAVREAVRTFIRAVAAEPQLRRTIRELELLDDRRLRDIGLTRESIERNVRFGRPADGAGQDGHGRPAVSPSPRGQ